MGEESSCELEAQSGFAYEQNYYGGGEMISEIWSLICEVALWGWVGAAIFLIIYSFPTRGKFSKRPAMVWGGLLMLFYVFWIVGMIMA